MLCVRRISLFYIIVATYSNNGQQEGVITVSAVVINYIATDANTATVIKTFSEVSGLHKVLGSGNFLNKTGLRS